jgi:hypothetical protein
METLKIGSTDIYLVDGERVGQGKITVSDGYRGAFTTSWGAMGSKLSEFLCGINEYYFAENMLGAVSSQVFDGKRSVTNIRKYIREELSYDLPWYIFMSAQKEMRQELKKLEECNSETDFVYRCQNFVDELLCDGLNYKDESEFKTIIRDVFDGEPWNYIATKESSTYLWLCDLHKKIKKRLKKSWIENLK